MSRTAPQVVERTWVVAAVVALVAAGCSHRAPTPAATPTTTGPTTIGPTTAGPTTAGPTTTSVPVPAAAGIAWKACAGHTGWQCGTLQVPLDHAHPGPTITLALNRHQATDPAHRIGSLLVNPGGPGASGVAFAYQAVDSLLDPTLVQHFDVIGFDPRGVGASTPVQCVDGPTLDQLNHIDPAPTTPAGVAALVAGAKELAAGCEAHSAALLPHVATVDAAEDMDDIRAAVGDPKLTYLGFSYGTLLGATYASLFPTHIRALALDGAIDPAIDEATMGADQAAGFEQDLDDFLAWCTASCAFQPRGAPTLRVAFDRLVAGIRAHPLPGSGGRTVGPGEAFVGIIAPLYDRQAWPVLAAELAAAQRGDGAPLLAQNDTYVERHPDGTYDNEEVANAAVNCLDHPTLPVAQLQSLAAATERQSPYFGAPLIWDSITCDSWPVPAVSRPGPLHAPGAPPILVLGSTGDPVTPYVWAQHLAAELGSGVLVTRHGDGHAAYPFSQCVRGIVDAYLVTGAVPSPAAADCSS